MDATGKILTPFQLELNEVSPFATYSNSSVEALQDDHFLIASTVEQCGIFTEDLTQFSGRSAVEHNNTRI
jgi:hypothetical protein